MKKEASNTQGLDNSINLPPQDIKTEPGQPTFKQALKKLLAAPKIPNKPTRII